jgi:exopolysaccharide production protein ExoQ
MRTGIDNSERNVLDRLRGGNVTVKVRLKHRERMAPRRSLAALPAPVEPPAHWLATISTWLMAFLLVYFSAGGSFSFYDPEANTQMGATTGAGGNSVIGAMVARIVLVGLIFVAWHSAVKIRKAVFCVPLLALLNFMGVISCLWSPEPGVTLKQGIYLLITYAFAIDFSTKPIEKQMKYMQLAGTIAVALTVLTVALFPKYGLNGRQGVTGEWEGIYAGKNVCALAMMFLLMPALYRKPVTLQGRVLRLVYIVSVLGVIGMTRSRTGWGIAVVLIFFSFGLKLLARFQAFDRSVLFLLFCGGTLLIGTVILLNLPTLFHFIGRDTTFSGRTQIWSAILDSIHKQPWTGYGYRAFWRGMTGESANVMIALGWMMGYAHNGFLSVWVEVGGVALGLLVLCLLKGLKDSWYCLMRDPSPQVLWYITTIVFGILYNIDEATFLFRFNLSWMMIIVAIVGLDRKRRQLRRRATLLAVRE